MYTLFNIIILKFFYLFMWLFKKIKNLNNYYDKNIKTYIIIFKRCFILTGYYVKKYFQNINRFRNNECDKICKYCKYLSLNIFVIS